MNPMPGAGMRSGFGFRLLREFGIRIQKYYGCEYTYIRTQVEPAKYQISRFDDAGGFLLLNTRRVSALYECHILLARFIFAHAVHVQAILYLLLT